MGDTVDIPGQRTGTGLRVWPAGTAPEPLADEVVGDDAGRLWAAIVTARDRRGRRPRRPRGAGSHDELLADIRRCRLELGAAVRLPTWMAALAVLEFGPALRSRRAQSVRELLAWTDETLPGLGDTLAMRASAQLAAGHLDAARATVAPVVAGDVPCAVPTSRVDARLVLATADLRTGRTRPADTLPTPSPRRCRARPSDRSATPTRNWSRC